MGFIRLQPLTIAHVSKYKAENGVSSWREEVQTIASERELMETATSDHGCSLCNACSDVDDLDSENEAAEGDTWWQSSSSSSSAPGLSCEG